MNLVGKIFVLLIFVMSLVFMSTAVMVYATHRNWKDEIFRTEAKAGQPLGLKIQLADSKKKNEELAADLEAKQKVNDAEAAAHKEALAKLETALGEKTQELANITASNVALNTENRKLTEELAVQQQNLAGKTAEVTTLRGQIRTVQAENDANAKHVVEVTEKNNQLAGDLGRLKERNTQLAEQVAKAGLLLAKVDMTIETPMDLQPPKVDGVVLATSGTQNNMLEISLGTDDGLRVGHTIDVYREGKYLARAEIKKIESNRAVALVDEKIHLGPIQKGDRVTTRIKT